MQFCIFTTLLSTLFLTSTCYTDVFLLHDKNQDVVGQDEVIFSLKGDTLESLSLQHKISLKDLKVANPEFKAHKKLKPNTKIIMPKHFVLPHRSLRDGVVINMAEQRLYFFPNDEMLVYTYPVAMGKAGWRTPIASTKVKAKTAHPVWYVPPSIRINSIDTHGYLLPEQIEPGPDNPLGTRAIYLNIPSILIHGNNNRSSIGRLASSGCIRMHNEDVEELYDRIGPGVPVHIIHHPVKVGFHDGKLVMESHEHVKGIKSENLDLNQKASIEWIEDYAQEYLVPVDWQHVKQVMMTNSGRPTIINERNDTEQAPSNVAQTDTPRVSEQTHNIQTGQSKEALDAKIDQKNASKETAASSAKPNKLSIVDSNAYDSQNAW